MLFLILFFRIWSSPMFAWLSPPPFFFFWNGYQSSRRAPNRLMFTGKEQLLNIFYSIFDDSVNFSPNPRIPDAAGREQREQLVSWRACVCQMACVWGSRLCELDRDMLDLNFLPFPLDFIDVCQEPLRFSRTGLREGGRRPCGCIKWRKWRRMLILSLA